MSITEELDRMTEVTFFWKQIWCQWMEQLGKILWNNGNTGIKNIIWIIYVLSVIWNMKFVQFPAEWPAFVLPLWHLVSAKMLSAKCTISLKFFLQFCIGDLFLWCFSPFPCLPYSQALAFLSSHFLCFLPCSLSSLSIRRRRQSQSPLQLQAHINCQGKEESPLCELPLSDGLDQIKWFWSTDSEWIEPGWPPSWWPLSTHTKPWVLCARAWFEFNTDFTCQLF